MNKLADIVSDILSDNQFATIAMGGKYYRIVPPTTFVLAKMLKPLSKLNVSDKDTGVEAIAKDVSQSKYIDACIAECIIGDKRNITSKFRLWRLRRRFRHANGKDRLEAFAEVLSISKADAFFLSAQLAMELTNRMARQRPPEATR